MTQQHCSAIIITAAEQRLPTVYPYRYYVKEGGIVSYGVDPLSLYRQAVSYVDRIFKGAKPADLPVQLPTKIELAVNLKTAAALGLEVSSALVARADEVVEWALRRWCMSRLGPFRRSATSASTECFGGIADSLCSLGVF